MDQPINDNQTADSRREELEGRFAYWRIAELEAKPVAGGFDAAHLKEVNRRIFQDLPAAGFDDVKPGEFRAPVPDGLDWMKQRGLSTVDGPFYVAYSRMDDAATARLDKALEAARPDELRGLTTPEFTAQLAKIYTELDYVHPFSDGNSRTLRTFTKQLAKEAGYEIDWERFGRNDVGRDLLYIARDRSVNELAKPLVQHENTMRKILHTQHRLEKNRALPDLLRDVVRPSRSVAFEQLAEQEALKDHPELKEAYQAMQAVAVYLASKLPGKLDAQEACMQSAMSHVQKRLNAGETADFFQGRQPFQALEKQMAQPERPAPSVDRNR